MKKTATVIGDSPVHGNMKGQKFTADLLAHEWDLLVAGGHVVIDDVKKEIEKATASANVETATKKD